MLAGPSAEASPLEILEQRQLIERLQAEHASDKVTFLPPSSTDPSPSSRLSAPTRHLPLALQLNACASSLEQPSKPTVRSR
jgi:hypothetical protein